VCCPALFILCLCVCFRHPNSLLTRLGSFEFGYPHSRGGVRSVQPREVNIQIDNRVVEMCAAACPRPRPVSAASVCAVWCGEPGGHRHGPAATHSAADRATIEAEGGSSDSGSAGGSSDFGSAGGSSDLSARSGSSDSGARSGSSDSGARSGSSDLNARSGSSDLNARSGSSDPGARSGSDRDAQRRVGSSGASAAGPAMARASVAPIDAPVDAAAAPIETAAPADSPALDAALETALDTAAAAELNPATEPTSLDGATGPEDDAANPNAAGGVDPNAADGADPNAADGANPNAADGADPNAADGAPTVDGTPKVDGKNTRARQPRDSWDVSSGASLLAAGVGCLAMISIVSGAWVPWRGSDGDEIEPGEGHNTEYMPLHVEDVL
jgi:hypothetical protein